MKLLLYCTKAKPYLIQGLAKPMHTLDANNPYNFNWKLVNKGFSNDRLNGKIVAECDFEVEKILPINESEDDYEYGLYDSRKDLVKESCLSNYDIYEYLQDDNGEIFDIGYAIHIKNLHIFDKPKELSEYYSIIDMGGGMLGTKPLTKAPQNMMHISINHWEYCFYNPDDINILISIQPQWLCKILNGEKTIEVRKKVLKGMIK